MHKCKMHLVPCDVIFKWEGRKEGRRAGRSPFLGSHLAASVDGAWVEHKVQHQNYDWKLLTSIGKVMKL